MLEGFTRVRGISRETAKAYVRNGHLQISSVGAKWLKDKCYERASMWTSEDKFIIKGEDDGTNKINANFIAFTDRATRDVIKEHLGTFDGTVVVEAEMDDENDCLVFEWDRNVKK